MRKPKEYKVKRFREIHHIADKIYVDKKVSKIIGIYPDTKKPKSQSLYGMAVKKTTNELIRNTLSWLAAVIVCYTIRYFLYGAMPIVANTLMIAMSIAAGLCILSYLVSFRYDVLTVVLSLDGTKLVQSVNEVAAKIQVEDNRDTNRENYRKLDALSQILDTELIRRKKIDLLLTFAEDFSYSWEFETDTVLLNSDVSTTLDYLEKVKRIDDAKLGPASVIYMQEKGGRK